MSPLYFCHALPIRIMDWLNVLAFLLPLICAYASRFCSNGWLSFVSVRR